MGDVRRTPTSPARWAALVLALPAALAGCADASEPARALAEQACRYPAPDAPNFDAQLADLALLDQLATTAGERSRLADDAAEGDERWQVLADAARALAVYADTIRDIRRSGGIVADELSPPVWDQVKYASDAFILECRPALEQPAG